MARKRETGKTQQKPGGGLSDTDRQRLAAATLLHGQRIGVAVERREFLSVLAAGLLPATWLASSSSNGGHV
jgi:hypothetical protein